MFVKSLFSLWLKMKLQINKYPLLNQVWGLTSSFRGLVCLSFSERNFALKGQTSNTAAPAASAKRPCQHQQSDTTVPSTSPQASVPGVSQAGSMWGEQPVLLEDGPILPRAHLGKGCQTFQTQASRPQLNLTPQGSGCPQWVPNHQWQTRPEVLEFLDFRELAWGLRLALVKASGPPNAWAESCLKGVVRNLDAYKRSGEVRILRGLHPRVTGPGGSGWLRSPSGALTWRDM